MRVKSSDEAHPPYEAVWYVAVWYNYEDLAILITISFLLHPSLSRPSVPPVLWLFAAWPLFGHALRRGATEKNLFTGQIGRNNLKSVIRTASYLAYYCMSCSCTTACQQLTIACQLHSLTQSEYQSWKGIFYDKQMLAVRTHGTLHLLRKCICADSDMHICAWWRADTDRQKTKNNG